MEWEKTLNKQKSQSKRWTSWVKIKFFKWTTESKIKKEITVVKIFIGCKTDQSLVSP